MSQEYINYEILRRLPWTVIFQLSQSIPTESPECADNAQSDDDDDDKRPHVHTKRHMPSSSSQRTKTARVDDDADDDECPVTNEDEKREKEDNPLQTFVGRLLAKRLIEEKMHPPATVQLHCTYCTMCLRLAALDVQSKGEATPIDLACSVSLAEERLQELWTATPEQADVVQKYTPMPMLQKMQRFLFPSHDDELEANKKTQLTCAFLAILFVRLVSGIQHLICMEPSSSYQGRVDLHNTTVIMDNNHRCAALWSYLWNFVGHLVRESLFPRAEYQLFSCLAPVCPVLLPHFCSSQRNRYWRMTPQGCTTTHDGGIHTFTPTSLGELLDAYRTIPVGQCHTEGQTLFLPYDVGQHWSPLSEPTLCATYIRQSSAQLPPPLMKRILKLASTSVRHMRFVQLLTLFMQHGGTASVDSVDELPAPMIKSITPDDGERRGSFRAMLWLQDAWFVRWIWNMTVSGCGGGKGMPESTTEEALQKSKEEEDDDDPPPTNSLLLWPGLLRESGTHEMPSPPYHVMVHPHSSMFLWAVAQDQQQLHDIRVALQYEGFGKGQCGVVHVPVSMLYEPRNATRVR